MREPEVTDEPAARLVAGFAAALRQAGLDVPPGASVDFASALGALGLSRREHAYWAGRSTLVRRHEDQEAYDEVFAAFFGPFGPVVIREPDPVRPAVGGGLDAAQESSRAEADRERRPPVLSYSSREVLRAQDFARYDSGEWQEARRLIAAMRSKPATRVSRRMRPHRRGQGPDLPRTVRMALSTDGEAIRRAWRRQSRRPRRLVLLVDVSGSMKPYARAFLALAHAWSVSRPFGSVEVFVLSTRVSRITRQLSDRDPDRALAQAGRIVEDWYGGTRLGEGLRAFNDSWGTRGLARGATVVFVSDGWDRGDPEMLGEQMRRLARVARRIVWVNPLRGSEGYEPIARGMAAALPFVDDFVDGHSLLAMERLVEAVSLA